MLAREHSLFEQVLIAVNPHLVVINLDDLDKRLKICLSERHRTRGEVLAHGAAKTLDQHGIDLNMGI